MSGLLSDGWVKQVTGAIELMFNDGERRARRSALWGEFIVAFGVPIVFWAVVFTQRDIRQWLAPRHLHVPQWHLLLIAAVSCPGAILFFAAPPLLKGWIATLRTGRAVVSGLQQQDPQSPIVERAEMTYQVIPVRVQLWAGLMAGMVMGLAWLFLATTLVAAGAFLAFWSGTLPE
jgi:hypothetical protein